MNLCIYIQSVLCSQMYFDISCVMWWAWVPQHMNTLNKLVSKAGRCCWRLRCGQNHMCPSPPGDSISPCNHRRAPVVFSSPPAELMCEGCVLAHVCVYMYMLHVPVGESYYWKPRAYATAPALKKEKDFQWRWVHAGSTHICVTFYIIYGTLCCCCTINTHNATNKESQTR